MLRGRRGLASKVLTAAPGDTCPATLLRGMKLNLKLLFSRVIVNPVPTVSATGYLNFIKFKRPRGTKSLKCNQFCFLLLSPRLPPPPALPRVERTD